MRIGKLFTFLALWGSIGFVLGTGLLIGPITLLTEYGRVNGWSEGLESGLVRGLIFLLFVVSAAAATWLTRVYFSPAERHIRVGVAVAVLLSVAGSVWLWMTPALMGRGIGSEHDVGTAFTFGPYPTPEKLESLRDAGYTGVVSLLHPAVVPFETRLIGEERAAVLAAGLEFHHAPMLPWVSDNSESLDLLETLAREDAGRYYVHCYLGKDRTRIAQRVVAAASPNAQLSAEATVTAHATRRILRDGQAFDRGKVVEVADGVFVVPFPTDDEYTSWIVTRSGVTVLSLLDPDNPSDKSWIDKERSLLVWNRVPFEERPLAIDGYDPERALAIAREAAAMPRPLIVHGFLALDSGRAPNVESFVQAFRSDLPPLPPALFQSSLRNGTARVIAPNVAIGPRPTKREFAGELTDRGIREFVFIGDPDSDEAREDRGHGTATGVAWRAIDGAGDDGLKQTLSAGGPWYLYGPGAAATEPLLAGLGPAIPARSERHPAPARIAAAPVAGPEATTASTAAPGPPVMPVARSGPWYMRALDIGVDLFQKAIPDTRSWILLTPLFLLTASAAAAFAGWLRGSRQLPAPYTRKIFHFTIFTLAGLVHITVGFSGVALFGGIVTLVVLYAVSRGDGFAFYEAMARPTDEPHRTMFIVIPLMTTAIGGLVSNALFGTFAFVGYLVVGWGDAMAEPVGTAFGRHRYKVPSLGGVPATRSLEGSAAVLLFGGAAAVLGLIGSGVAVPAAVSIGLACGLAGTLLEAISNHGLDNLTVQIAASATAWLLLM